MKKIFGLSLIITLAFTACKKEIIPMGDIELTTRYEAIPEAEVKVYLYNSYQNYLDYVYLEEDLSDEYGKVYFYGLEPGKYYLEAEKIKSSQFTIYEMDSLEVFDGQVTKKIMNLLPLVK